MKRFLVDCLITGLAGGLLNTSFQFGGALVLAVVTAVNNAQTGGSGSAEDLLEGFHPAVVVSLAGTAGEIVAFTRVRTYIYDEPSSEVRS